MKTTFSRNKEDSLPKTIPLVNTKEYWVKFDKGFSNNKAVNMHDTIRAVQRPVLPPQSIGARPGPGLGPLHIKKMGKRKEQKIKNMIAQK